MTTSNKNIVIICAFFVVFFLSGIGIIISHPALELDRIEISGYSGSVLEKIQQSLEIDKQNIFLISTREIERSLESFDRIERCNVSRILPNRLNIQIIEHSPVVLVNLDGMGGLSRNKIFVPIQDASSIPDLPILTGANNSKRPNDFEVIDSPIMTLAVKFILDLEEIDPTLRDLISEIRFEDEGLVILLRQDSLPIYLGSINGAAKNFSRFQLASESIEYKRESLVYIDARFQDCLVLKHMDEKWTS